MNKIPKDNKQRLEILKVNTLLPLCCENSQQIRQSTFWSLQKFPEEAADSGNTFCLTNIQTKKILAPKILFSTTLNLNFVPNKFFRCSVLCQHSPTRVTSYLLCISSQPRYFSRRRKMTSCNILWNPNFMYFLVFNDKFSFTYLDLQ